ncbi:DNA mismatch repair protein MutH [Ferrimonas balearica DSM 9799]|uniref:DNA mismatch repair protein MutH n=1 Tax=Ferrimonas balearica (strain DSM 9799 / CCM 4581 / KCTC 23876 / PAT) TaxID=550540 RepID=E1SRV5_FERBD|nr:DNA mismatch repair endonuclease MutH [Ferrimonas balearica]MBY6018882.1 DNA mismatch repair endonuclease MutH [Halomonas denitrificans]ADN74924.1 DNA mismatch repair protein MutH [Ferrimonas balearica DSM 9799]MBY5981492.1 DNA mismatch repair endonuclease MutH [Ferrimonas balearica]MBY6096072.1 DNA mismatch repair endonuclease MutH [Ferrimonas balearica]MBY6107470.1 DNA mismatch repair endonuclease MutH [Ferrimonas balearica]
MPHSSPQSLDQLMDRAYAMAGLTLGEIAAQLGVTVPADLKRHKGWGGQLLELWLGASAGSRPEPDFPHLGVELKSLPIDEQGKPLESTYICVCPLTDLRGLRWQDSVVCHKLSRVLWIPVEGSRTIPVAERRVGMPLLWQPDPDQEATLRRDWEELMEQVALGQVEQITAHQGEILQLRPKAANRRVLTEAIGPDGHKIQTLPRGFYLRSRFTAELLAQHYL